MGDQAGKPAGHRAGDGVMSEFAVSAATRASVNALQSINAQMNTLQRRIATGKKVNDPTDNPAAFFTSSALANQAAALGTVLSNVSSVTSTISAATNGISAIQALVSQAQTLANNALASAGATVSVAGTLTLTTNSTIATNGGAGNRFKVGDTVTVSDGTTTATYTAANNDTLQTFLNAINGTSGLKVTASLNASGKVELDGQAGTTVTVGATLNGAGGATLTSVLGLSAGTTTPSGNTTRTSYATQYNALLTQIDQLAADASFNGVNLLTGGSVSASFNETGSSSYSVSGVSATSSGLGLTSISGGFQTDAEINGALSKVTAALSSLQSSSSQFSTAASVIDTRTSFTTSMIDFLNTTSDDLVATDTNEDGAALLALQTRQQVASTMLSLTQSVDNTVLRLFGLS
jgi:flagellin-like hook-associated protein FlgL